MNRRHFLTHSAVAAAGSALVPAFAASPAAKPAGGEGPYAPGPKPGPVVKPGEFVFAAAHFDHNHIAGQCSALAAAGATRFVECGPGKVLTGLNRRIEKRPEIECLALQDTASVAAALALPTA